MKNASRCAVVFDWNGTVLADSALCLAANNATFERLGLKPVSAARFQEIYTVPLVHIYTALGAKAQEVLARRDELASVFVARYEPFVSRLRVRKGARRALEVFHERGNKCAILSNYTIEKIKPQVERLRLAPYFDAILANEASSSVYQKGGKGDRLKAFIKRHGIEKGLVVGDTPEEIEIARQFGFTGVALSGGVCSVARLRAAEPDFLVSTLDDLPAIAKKVFGGGGG